ncbi:RNA polymerase sigma factor [Micromonospora sagamiensis]|uniref:RNA polymerase sigma-70 factor (ECF subfamily) n=1 Tax=Micromonospora sagamiensis TaxID=47875 RepID=A0A562WNE0_9ACTN|nr:RNA polymerase sigma-70 factor (ECF subfamily) [Micromonospora sagamiensis]BCL15240.1 RNA polymerase sigma factor [Micromonospora sagamiensis]
MRRTPRCGDCEETAISDHDAHLLRALHDEHADALHAYALRLVDGDRQRAEDLVQETLLRAWRSPASLDPERGSVRAWLFTTARNLAIDAWRRRSTRVGEVVTDALPEPPPTVDEAERAVEAWTIAEALSRLSPTHREVLVECFYQGRSVAEAAARLGVPPGTVKSRTHYALRSLRLVLAEMGVTK